MNTIYNVNRFLENSKRSDVWGYNIYSRGKSKSQIQWDAPSLGLTGDISIGHELDSKNIVVPQFSINGKVQDFVPQRNRWTPAFMDTYYRSKPSGEYKKSGLLAVRERKCFTENDVFVSHLTLTNDGRDEMQIEVSLVIPYSNISESVYRVESKILPKSIKKELTLKGFLAADFSCEAKCFTIPPQSSIQLKYGFAFSPISSDMAKTDLSDAMLISNPFDDAEKRFNLWMETNAPQLETENLDLLKVYYYRFFVIKCAIHNPCEVLPESEYKGECIYESPFGGWFGAPIGLPIPLQTLDMKWMKDTSALRSNIKNWCRGVGTMQDYIQCTPMAIWQYYLQTGDKTILTEFYESVCNFTIARINKIDTILPQTHGSWITGAEYQPSFYQYTTPPWDWRHDHEGADMGFKNTVLHRVDESVMYGANILACKLMAEQLGKTEDEDYFSNVAESVLSEIENLLWNEDKHFFFDFDPSVGKPCDKAYSYGGFTPLMFGLLGSDFDSVFEHLGENGRFDGSFGVTSVDKECPMYWFDNCIAGPTASSVAEPHEYGCSWNGPIWPFAVSLVLEALGYATYENPQLADTFNRIFSDYTELHFDFGDRTLPCIREHYRPSDGTTFSSYTEYFHSEWINLLFSYYLGIRVKEDGIDFLPATEECFSVSGVVIKGKSYRFTQEMKDGVLTRTITELK